MNAADVDQVMVVLAPRLAAMFEEEHARLVDALARRGGDPEAVDEVRQALALAMWLAREATLEHVHRLLVTWPCHVH